MKKLNFFLFCFLLLTLYIVIGDATTTAITTTWSKGIWKRDTGLPFEELSNKNCTVPSICSEIYSIGGINLQCRCNDIITVCKNGRNQYCWGSKTLSISGDCPTAITDPCHNDFNSSVSCLCNDKKILCVDRYNHYCYGTIVPSKSGPNSVSIQPLIPTSSSSSLSLSSSSSSSVLSSSLIASQTATETPADPSMGVSYRPSLTLSFYLFMFLVFLFISLL